MSEVDKDEDFVGGLIEDKALPGYKPKKDEPDPDEVDENDEDDAPIVDNDDDEGDDGEGGANDGVVDTSDLDSLDKETLEELARQEGWVPPDDYSGPGKPLSAKEFVRRGREILPIVRSRMTKLERQLADQARKHQQDLNGLTRTHSVAMKLLKERMLEDLKVKRREAQEDGDLEGVDQFDAKIKEVDGIEVKEIADDADDFDPTQQPEVQEFLQANPWYGNDLALTEYADRVSQYVRAKLPKDATPDMYFKQLTDAVKERFPSKFKAQNPRRKRAPQVEGRGDGREGSDMTQRRSNKKSFADLPPDAKAACKQFIKEGIFKKEQDYVDIYYSS